VIESKSSAEYEPEEGGEGEGGASSVRRRLSIRAAFLSLPTDATGGPFLVFMPRQQITLLFLATMLITEGEC
jgi:glycerol-3-phosphate acyltransferase PlsY